MAFSPAGCAAYTSDRVAHPPPSTSGAVGNDERPPRVRGFVMPMVLVVRMFGEGGVGDDEC